MTDIAQQNDFADVSRQDWERLAEKGLKGAEFVSLISHTEDGLVRGPLFDRADRPDHIVPHTRSDAPLLDGRPWHICATVSDPEPEFANAQLLDDLKGGASAVRFGSVKTDRRADVRRLLEGVLLDLVPVIFAPNSPAAAFAADMEELQTCSVTLGLDPCGPRPDVPSHWRAFMIDAADIHEKGGADTLELAIFAATLAEGLRRHGADAHSQISAQFAVGPDAHLNIVKLRAARRIYAAVTEAFGIKGAMLPLHAVTSHRMMQSVDAWTNLLRTSSAGFGAIVGGADYLCLRPFTDTPTERRLGHATPFGHRIARNQQLLMMEESYLGHVRDAAYGSYFHEKLTDTLAQAAWSQFQSIEVAGGLVDFEKSGALQDCIETDISNRAKRDEPILGVTLHPSDDVPTPEVRT
jgi:methylmalonyl-CoA mutase